MEKKMNLTNQLFIGRITLVAGISALMQLILLVLMFTVSRNLFGTASDYFYALTPLLIVPLVIALPRILGAQYADVSRVARVMGIVGLLIASLAQIILLLKVINLKQSIWGNLVGLGLVGLPILIMALINLGSPGLPASFN